MRLSEPCRQYAPKDLAQELGPGGIRQLLLLLCKSYKDLLNSGFVQADTGEDTITEEWFVQIQKRWKRDRGISLVPMSQKQDKTKAAARGRPPTIDFCFRDEAFPECYFGVECKLLDADSAAYLGAYLDDKEGIGRFLNGKYAARTGAGAMAGYVRTGEAKAVAAELKKAINTLTGNPTLSKSAHLPGFEHLYESTHTRISGISPFICFHLLFAFCCSSAA